LRKFEENTDIADGASRKATFGFKRAPIARRIWTFCQRRRYDSGG